MVKADGKRFWKWLVFKAGIKLINEITVRENDNAKVQENTEFLNKV